MLIIYAIIFLASIFDLVHNFMWHDYVSTATALIVYSKTYTIFFTKCPLKI